MTNTCKYCGIELNSNKKGVCNSCKKKNKSKYNKDRHLKIKNSKSKIKKMCVICKKEIFGRSDKKYCKECKYKHDYQSEHHTRSVKKYIKTKKGQLKRKEYYSRPKVIIKNREHKKKWRINHRIQYNVIQARRRKRMIELNITHSFSYDEWQNKLDKTKGVCPGYKRKPHFVGIEKLEIDHIIPVSKAKQNFTYTINDIQPLCRMCNLKKGNKL